MTQEERNKKLKEITENFGIMTEIKKLNEETYELVEASLLSIASLRNKECEGCENRHIAITYEIADVLVVLNQIKLFFDIKDEEIEKCVDFKIERTLRRIKGDDD